MRQHDFDQRFDQFQNEFDRDWKRARRRGPVFGLFGLLVKLSLLGFGVWVVLKLLQHYGIV